MARDVNFSIFCSRNIRAIWGGGILPDHLRQRKFGTLKLLSLFGFNPHAISKRLQISDFRSEDTDSFLIDGG